MFSFISVWPKDKWSYFNGFEYVETFYGIVYDLVKRVSYALLKIMCILQLCVWMFYTYTLENLSGLNVFLVNNFLSNWPVNEVWFQVLHYYRIVILSPFKSISILKHVFILLLDDIVPQALVFTFPSNANKLKNFNKMKHFWIHTIHQN